MSSMKAETPVIRSTAQNLLLHWADGVPTTTTADDWTKTWLCWVISEYFHQSDQKKKYVFRLILFKNTCVYSFLWIAIHWVCRIDRNRSDKISVHRDAPLNHYTPINSLRPADVIWHLRYWPTSVQVMACCLMASSHYMNHSWFTIKLMLSNTSH